MPNDTSEFQWQHQSARGGNSVAYCLHRHVFVWVSPTRCVAAGTVEQANVGEQHGSPERAVLRPERATEIANPCAHGPRQAAPSRLHARRARPPGLAERFEEFGVDACMRRHEGMQPQRGRSGRDRIYPDRSVDRAYTRPCPGLRDTAHGATRVLLPSSPLLSPARSRSFRERAGAERPVASTQHTGFWPRCALCICAPCGESARAACARGRRGREPKGCCACDAVLCRMPDAKKVAIASASCVSFHVSATHCVMHALRRAVGAISSGLVLSACLEKGLPCGGVLCSL